MTPKEKLDQAIREAREGAIKGFSQLNANINKAMEAMTGTPAPESCLNPGESVSVWEGERLEQLIELITFMRRETTDTDERVIILRALAIYRSHVSHVKAGGEVVYEPAPGSDAKKKKLTVHLR